MDFSNKGQFFILNKKGVCGCIIHIFLIILLIIIRCTLKLKAYDSLTKAALESKGDVNKPLDVWKYFVDSNKNNGITISRLFNRLCIEKLIIYNQRNDTFTVTRKGFYYAIKSTGLTPENFEMISYQEAERLSIQVLRFMCKMRYTETFNVTLSEIKFETYGKGVVNQVIDLLVEMNLIKFSDKTFSEIQITNKGIAVALRAILSV